MSTEAEPSDEEPTEGENGDEDGNENMKSKGENEIQDDPFEIGDYVTDSENDDSGIARVINRPSNDEGERIPSDEWVAFVDWRGNKVTVAEDNPDYPADAPVVVTLFEQQLERHRPDWNGSYPLALGELSEDDITHYSFPADRLEFVDNSETPDEADTDEQQVAGKEAAKQKAAGQEENANPDSDPDPDPDANPNTEPPEPPENLQVIAEDLESSADVGLVYEADLDEYLLEITKLGATYTIDESGNVTGDGPHTSAIASKVDELF